MLELLTKSMDFVYNPDCEPAPCGPDYGVDCLPDCDPQDDL